MSFWGNRKPPFGTRLDWNHPLCSGLVLYYLHTNECGWQDCVGGYELTTVGFDTKGVDAIGVGKDYGGIAGRHHVVLADARLYLTDKITVTSAQTFWQASTFQRLISRRAGGDAESYVLSPSGTQHRFLCGISGYKVASGGAIALHVPDVTSGTFDGANIRLYHQGSQVAVTTQSGAMNAMTGRGVGFGAEGDGESGGVTGATCIQHVAAIHNRPLSAEEIAWLHAEPYAMFEPQNLEVFYSIPAGVTFNPAWAMNSNQVLYV